MNAKVLFLLGLVAVVAADKRPSNSYAPPRPSYSAPQPSYSAPRPSYDSDESFEAPKYNFGFDVEDGYSGADFEHQEARDEDNTHGSYTVQLPDGRLQKVTYYVDGDSGYVAEVTYEGEAQYPESAESREYSAPRPSYSAPKPAPRPTYSAPRPTPRPSYSAPDSHESREFYAPPSNSYGFPQ